MFVKPKVFKITTVVLFVFLLITVFNLFATSNAKAGDHIKRCSCTGDVNINPPYNQFTDICKLVGSKPDTAKQICPNGKIALWSSNEKIDCVNLPESKVRADLQKKFSMVGKIDNLKCVPTDAHKLSKNAPSGGSSPSGTPSTGSSPSSPSSPSNDICAGATTASSLLKCAGKQLNPGIIKTPNQLIGYGVKFEFAMVGAVAMTLYIWAGFLYMTAGGNAERRGKAVKTLLWVTLGIVVMFASYMILQFVFTEIVLK